MLQKIMIGLSLIPLLLFPRMQEVSQSQADKQFCSQRTAAAYHSPKCDWGFAVDDPCRVENVTILHDPPYHTYSRWVVRGKTYIFAYRDVDYQTEDMRVDIYSENGQGKVVACIRITGMETHVFSTSLTGPDSQDIAFKYLGGELQYLSIVRFTDTSVGDVFDCAATAIDIFTRAEPKIIARYSIANVVKEFAWDRASDKFINIRESPWHRRP